MSSLTYSLGERNEPQKESIKCRFTTKSIWIAAIIIVFILFMAGFVLHELYKWTGNAKAVGYFAPTSESVWEHLKLIYVPFIIAGAIMWWFIGLNTGNYVYALALSILIACAFIVVAFYTYTGITGIDNVIVDIIIFGLAVILGAWLFYWAITQPTFPYYTIILAWIILIAFAIAFIAFSYNPPNIPLFKN